MSKLEHVYQKNFKYKHDNPYHERLSGHNDFVFRDNEAEEFQGNWNKDVFKREAPICVEIGSGYGHFMIEYLARFPEHNFIGMDYRFKRSFELAKRLKRSVENLESKCRYLRARGERIRYIFDENEVENIFYFFPDPWPKTRHHKKRLFKKEFLMAASKTLSPGGKLYVKTDHDGYADQMEKVIKDQNLFNLKMETRDLKQEFPDHFLASFETKFEKIFLDQGVKIKAYVLENK